jgi:hypothetical protein
VAVGDSAGGRRAPLLFKEGKLSDLSPGVSVTLTLSADQTTVESLVAEGPVVRGLLQGVDFDEKYGDDHRAAPAADQSSSRRGGPGGDGDCSRRAI